MPIDWWLADLYLHYYRGKEPVSTLCDNETEGDAHERLENIVGPVWLSGDGLVISTLSGELPHALQGCAPEVTVPYSEILPYFKKGGFFQMALGAIAVQMK